MSAPREQGRAYEDPRMDWGPGEWFAETQRLEAEVERLREELRIAQFDANVARGECDMAIASATQRLREAFRALIDQTPGSHPLYQVSLDALLEASSSEPRP